MAVQPLPKGPLGYVCLKKTAGQAVPIVTTQFNFPMAFVNPRNPNNLSYFQSLNAANALSLKVAGKKTPSVTISCPLKVSWFTGATGMNAISDFLGVAASFLDSGNNSSEYGIQINDSVASRVYDGCKCTQLSFYQTGVGGPITMDMTWLGIYGDSEKGVPTTFGAFSTDGGSLMDVTNVDFNSTMSDVAWWRLTLMRPQGYQPTCDGTLYMASVESGMIGGTFVMQAGAASGVTIPSTSATIKIGTTPNGIGFTLNLSKDEKQEDVVPSLLPQINSYTLFNSGSYPIQLATF